MSALGKHLYKEHEENTLAYVEYGNRNSTTQGVKYNSPPSCP
jgi:hypothetical protein